MTLLVGSFDLQIRSQNVLCDTYNVLSVMLNLTVLHHTTFY